MQTNLIPEINNTFDELIRVYSSFKDEQIDIVPFKDSWTAGQVAEHITKAISNLPQFLYKNTAPTDRAADKSCEMLRMIFLDFTSKMKSPEFILPLEAHHNKQEQLKIFTTLQTQMLGAVKDLDLSATCKGFEMPGLGFLTRLEWLTFFMVHTQRHTHQLKNIYDALNK